MTRKLLFAALLLAACSSSKSRKPEPATQKGAPEIQQGRPQLYEIRAARSREIVGYIERKSYSSGRVLYWLYNADRTDTLGYMEESGRAYRFEWEVGFRNQTHTFVGADSFAVGARRILEHDGEVVLVQITEKQYLDHLRETGALDFGKPEVVPPKKNGGSSDEEDDA